MYKMNEPKLSFAQFGEDMILDAILCKIKEPIFYIDVGANHPIILSVTYWFYLNGASGINIDPLPSMFDELQKFRGRDINLRCACGAASGELELFVHGGTDDGATLVDKFALSDKSIAVPVRRLDDIYSEYAAGKTVHFCKIDVEGFERQVLEGLDFNVFRPYVFCMESTVPGSMIPNHAEFEHILLDNGYEFIGQHSINRYYADKNQMSKLNAGAHVFDLKNNPHYVFKCFFQEDIAKLDDKPAQDSRTKKIRIKLFGFIPLLTIKKQTNKCWLRLFGFIPLIKIK